MSPPLDPFPVLTALQSIVDSIQTNPVTILDAPPGTGKTTALPIELLRAGVSSGKKICILEPRRIAAKSAAKRISQTLNENLGDTVGYRVRFDTKIGNNTKIEFLTDGILTKILLSDPELKDYGLVVFDEFHERRMDSDLCFALTRRTQEVFRNDLKILVMSATLDGQNFESLGIRSKPIEVRAVTHPLEIFHMGDSIKNTNQRLLDLIPKAVEQTAGDILVFLSGKKEIRDLRSSLESISVVKSNAMVLGLYGDMDLADQEKIFLPSVQGKKKIILSTNIAESSITIPGVRVVFDSGYEKHLHFDTESGVSHLIKERISLSSAKQRAGRAAREGKGLVYRLWSKEEEKSLLDRTKPEILEGDIDRLVLEIKSWGEEIEELPFLDPPNRGSVIQSTIRLKLLGCLDSQGNLTKIGKECLRYPLPIRLGKILAILPKEEEKLITDIVSLVGKESTGTEAKNVSEAVSPSPFSYELKSIYEQILRIYREKTDFSIVSEGQNRLYYLSAGFPDRIAKAKVPGGKSFKLSNGKLATLNTTSIQIPEYILVLDTISFGQEIYITQYLAIEETQIEKYFSDIISRKVTSEKRTNQRGESFLVVKEERSIGDLVLDSKETNHPNPTILGLALEEYLAKSSLEDEWKKNPELIQFYNRVKFLEQYGVLNTNSDFNHLKQIWKEWLFPFINLDSGKLSLDKLPFLEAFKAYVGYENLNLIDSQAPISIQVPSGSKIQLNYEGMEPELHVKLQELFGLRSLPKLANGKVNILIHLLSPARRPVQITKDLESFWNQGYHEVKKELKGRYPKHPWPDKPWEAVPTKHLNHTKRS
ncbi:ATP-dependent helicase HrpB [Leptospira sp. 2 VSF19]|uniref:ATP-dependent helicase HrpB n=1 Tax=Leptospira soteropolitanensis TaxID=2950025 RepID=A0AAW5VFW5_9LEPT|nr:ATP-dependent helicase HrpB [Leptospira soteropolitanensis]MCW7492460.1 ATP-dependent helicase HrpB [Leptospira soteropolitanensis]MCW7500511.1 ATP-dependent helicase HrpB [Leptospira soteropolitanensis]MCW7522819.1 ATP-dependent helicase HrpB [Leptospira soteropolitanensis]MCW7526678.1 ATP-dependent helicase HrpB [Leptospira soteropolitanensis]MCW7530481.1 ATP-dependent helicase HrpB [Leptospira soteropolitanensis]